MILLAPETIPPHFECIVGATESFEIATWRVPFTYQRDCKCFSIQKGISLNVLYTLWLLGAFTYITTEVHSTMVHLCEVE